MTRARAYDLIGTAAVTVAFLLIAVAVGVALTGCDDQPKAAPARVSQPEKSAAELTAERDAIEMKAIEARLDKATAEEKAAEAEAAAEKAENKLRLGKEAGKAAIARAGDWIGRAAIATLLAGVGLTALAAFRGGLSLGRGASVAGVGLACFAVQYFVIAHGYAVSETGSVIAMVAMVVALALSLAYAALLLWKRWEALGLAARLDAEGKHIDPAIALLPVAQKTRSQLSTAFDLLRSAPTFTPRATLSLGTDQLERHGLPVPAPEAKP